MRGAGQGPATDPVWLAMAPCKIAAFFHLMENLLW